MSQVDGPSRISMRGQQLAATDSTPEYLSEHMARAATPSDPGHPPYVCLAVSENKLMWDILSEKVNVNRRVEPRSMAYDSRAGSADFREAIASFTGKELWGRSIDPDHVITMAGAGPVIESLADVLADPGEGILIPTPTYAVYWFDMETRAHTVVVPAPMSFDDGLRIDASALERAFRTSPVPIRALLLTNPSNPTGQIHSHTEMLGAIQWARRHGLHVIVNEIYGLSSFGETPFASVATMLPDLGDDVHLVWAFSKDLSMSGVRSGVLVSENDELRKAIDLLAAFARVSGDTQHLLTTMLRDADWVDSYLRVMRSRLATARSSVETVLGRHGLASIPSDAGLFTFADLRPLLNEPTWEAEHQAWEHMLTTANVNLTPGAACRSPEPGFMRICFATEPTDVVVDALDRALSVAAGQ